MTRRGDPIPEAFPEPKRDRETRRLRREEWRAMHAASMMSARSVAKLPIILSSAAYQAQKPVKTKADKPPHNLRIWRLDGQADTVSACTKSEARSIFKKWYGPLWAGDCVRLAS